MMSNPLIRAKNILKDNGYSITPQRLAVFNALLDKEPQSTSELIAGLKGELDKASLYRTIQLFERIGIVNRITIGWKYKIELSEHFLDHHHHLLCLGCDKIIPITEKDLELFIGQLSSKFQFRHVRHQIDIEGYCIECQKDSDTTSKIH